MATLGTTLSFCPSVCPDCEGRVERKPGWAFDEYACAACGYEVAERTACVESTGYEFDRDTGELSMIVKVTEIDPEDLGALLDSLRELSDE